MSASLNKQDGVQQAVVPKVVFTESAARKVLSLMLEEDEALSLRVYITGGGCSGFQYGFSFDNKIKDNDTVITTTVAANDEGNEQSSGGSTAVNLVIDPMSLMYLVGAEVDYTDGLEGGQFVIRNPNAQTTCGCGSSFSV